MDTGWHPGYYIASLYAPVFYKKIVGNADYTSLEKVLRLLIIILLLVLLYLWLKRFFPGEKPGGDESRIAKMVQCDHCRLYIPHTSAIKHAARFYCCDEHKESAAGKTP